ncbi:hypothetical protein ACFFGH_09865 [Lysobacter korlensis]|uniref:Permease n=1 Tax=Lysobacter korlensis TaxID=553636 RepID=A0ABV6RMD4_9GAMM
MSTTEQGTTASSPEADEPTAPVRPRDTGRLRLRGVAPPLRVIVIVGLAVSLALALVVIVPAWRAAVSAAGLGSVAPQWVRIVAFSACGALSALALAAALVRATPGPHRVRGSRLVLAAIPVLAVAMPALWMAGNRNGLLLAAICLVSAGASATSAIAAVLPPRQQTRQAAWVMAAGVCAGLPWILAAAHAVAVGSTDRDLLWLSLTLMGSGLTLALALYGLVRAAESRSDRVTTLRGRRDGSLRVAWVVLGVVALLYAVRFVWLSGFFAGDAMIWRWAGPETWPHALLVAGVLVAVVVRSEAAPVRPRGRISVFLVLITAVSLGVSVASVWGGLVVLVDLVFPGGFGTIDGVLAVLGTPVVLPAVAGALVFVVLPACRHSMGRMVSLVAVVHLLPLAISEPWDPSLSSPLLERWFAPATMVLAASVLIVAALLVIKTLRPGSAIPIPALIRLLVLPFVAVHALVLLPAALELELAPVVAAVGAVLALLVFRRPVAADRWAQSGNVLGATTAAVFTLTVFAFSLADPEFVSQTDPVAILWLVVPLAAALCLSRRAPSRDAEGGGGAGTAVIAEPGSARRPGSVPSGR